MRCEDVQKELEAFISNDIDEQQKTVLQEHLDQCPHCTQALQQLTKLSEVLQTWKGLEPPPFMYDKLKSRIKDSESFWGRISPNPTARRFAFELVKVAAVVILTLMVSHWLRKPIPETPADSTTINFYLKEHQGVIAQTVSANLSTQEPERMHVRRDDIMYYEFFEHRPEFRRPGIIVRGPTSQQKIASPEIPTISNGRDLTLSQAQSAVNFDVIAPSRFHPGYILDKIRKIEGRNSLQLLYTDGINTISLFEQPVEGEQRLAVQDFREYAVYQNKGKSGGTILAWGDNALSYVLIGNAEMPRLMEMAQSISATNRREKQ